MAKTNPPSAPEEWENATFCKGFSCGRLTTNFPFLPQFSLFFLSFHYIFWQHFFDTFCWTREIVFLRLLCVLVFPLSIYFPFFILLVFFWLFNSFSFGLISRAPFNLSWWQNRLSLAATSWQPGQSTIKHKVANDPVRSLAAATHHVRPIKRVKREAERGRRNVTEAGNRN